MTRKISRARWYDHVNAVAPPAHLRGWLTEGGSLTAKLRLHCTVFGVRRVSQHLQPCAPEAMRMLDVTSRCRLAQRDVVLLCDGQPAVIGHTVVKSHAMREDWPFFKALGTQPLGEKLFTDPMIVRGALQYAQLPPDHPLMRRAREILDGGRLTQMLYARRSAFYRKGGVMLVTEIFLPAITTLMAS